MVRDTKLYDRLGVDQNASDADLKKAFRKLSMKWHPDKNPDNNEEATKKFQEISEAYSILSDPEKRSKYDQIGIDFVKNQDGGPGIDPNDIFSQFFGGNSPFGGSPFGFNFGGQGGQEHLPIRVLQLYRHRTLPRHDCLSRECRARCAAKSCMTACIPSFAQGVFRP